ncbi:hypothetical protein [Terrarubrum flagellatum]|uniref:hypothetical protein n=1 Tax=Terrirubrum flagellatum TaxID=2895980 RepID=UPI00314564AD
MGLHLYLKRLTLTVAATFATVGLAFATTPPTQPEKGPGGAEYAITTAQVKKEAVGAGADQVFIFRPTAGFTGPRPVVVFAHAYDAFNPLLYGAWIDHLVRRGSIVVFPRYQLDQRTVRADYLQRATNGVKAAMAALGADADASKVAYVGHAAGGNILANLAVNPELWKPKLLFALMPGNSWGNRYQAVKLDDLGKLPSDMIIMTLIAEIDRTTRDTDARRMIRESSSIPASHKLLIRLYTDTHGTPSMVSTHLAPLAKNPDYEMDKILGVAAPPAPQLDAKGRPKKLPPGPARIVSPQPEYFGGAEVDGVDWFCFWKTLDIAMPLAFAGEDALAIRKDPNLTLMGVWSDGWPVKRFGVETPREKPAQAEAPPEPAKPAPATAARRPVRR